MSEPTKTAERVCGELYEALENLLGDLYLLGLAEIKLEDVYGGSAREAMKVLKRNQEYRQKDQTLAIGQKAGSTEGPTGCLDDTEYELSDALKRISPERLSGLLNSELGED